MALKVVAYDGDIVPRSASQHTHVPVGEIYACGMVKGGRGEMLRIDFQHLLMGCTLQLSFP